MPSWRTSTFSCKRVALSSIQARTIVPAVFTPFPRRTSWKIQKIQKLSATFYFGCNIENTWKSTKWMKFVKLKVWSSKLISHKLLIKSLHGATFCSKVFDNIFKPVNIKSKVGNYNRLTTDDQSITVYYFNPKIVSKWAPFLWRLYKNFYYMSKIIWHRKLHFCETFFFLLSTL